MRSDFIGRVFVLAVSATATAAVISTASAQQAARPPQSAPAQGSGPASRPVQAPAKKAATPVAAKDPAAAAERMKPLLKAWEQRSAQLKSLDVEITRVDESEAWGIDQYEGRAMLKSPNLARLDFSKVDKTDPKKPKLVHDERIICTGKEVWQYKSPQKQISIFTLDKENQKRALEEGPLPFLFNMKAAAAEARYKMSLISEAKDHWVIEIVPLLQVDQEAFSLAFLRLTRENYLPDRIKLISPNGKDTKEFFLRSVKPNANINDQNFVGTAMPKPWTMVRNPGIEAPAAPGGNPAANVGARPRNPAPAPRR